MEVNEIGVEPIAEHPLEPENLLSEAPLEVQTETSFSFDLDAKPEDLPETVDTKEGAPNASTDPLRSEATDPSKVQGTVKKYLNGKLLVDLTDIGLSRAVIFLPALSNCKPSDFKLSQSEKDDLAPLAQAVIDEMDVNISPIAAFIFVFVAMYSFKIITLWNYGKDKDSKKIKHEPIIEDVHYEKPMPQDTPAKIEVSSNDNITRKRGRPKGYSPKKKAQSETPKFDKDGIQYAIEVS
jgi:hypothetical protein